MLIRNISANNQCKSTTQLSLKLQTGGQEEERYVNSVKTNKKQTKSPKKTDI